MPNRTRTKPDAGAPSEGKPAEAIPASPPQTGVDADVSRVWPTVQAALDRDAAAMASETPINLAARTAELVASYREAARPATLNEADAATLDAVMLAKQAGSAPLLTAELADRREGVEKVLALLDRDTPAAFEAAGAGPDDLAIRTMDAVRAARQRERFAQQIDMLRDGPPSAGVSFRQIFSAAAILLLGVTLLLPMLQQSRNSAMQAACLSNLGLAGMAFNTYTADHAGVFPRAASVPGASWWNVGRPDAVTPDGKVQSNSAHLFLIVRGGYISADRLVCAGNAYADQSGPPLPHQFDWSSPLAISYSYQNQFTPQVLRADEAAPELAVLADKNPLFVPKGGRLVFDASTKITDASRQHGGDGQNALRIDGAAAWTIAPNFAGSGGQTDRPDVFWAVQGKPADHRYTGRELPDGVNRDAFLVP
ncbi:MAG: hypothetical protein AAF916_09970 [Planctomycetota bacterium]